MLETTHHSKDTKANQPTAYTIQANWVLPVSSLPVQHGFVRVEHGKIVAVGKQSEASSEWLNTDQTSLYKASIVAPGFVNAHTHLEQSHGTVIPKQPDEPMGAWLLNVVQHAQQQTDTSYRTITQQGIQECLSTGTTAVNDISRDGLSLPLIAASGLKGMVSIEFFHPDATLNHERLEQILQTYTQLCETTSSANINVGLAPHSVFNVSPEALTWIIQNSPDKHQPLIHIHVGESDDEDAFICGDVSEIHTLHQTLLGRTFPQSKQTCSVVELLDTHQLLSSNLITVHGRTCSQNDLKLLAKNDASLVLCPRSNITLHGDTVESEKLTNVSALNIALGTDGHLSATERSVNSTYDMRAEARVAMQYYDWSATEALEHSTLSGAHVLKSANHFGSIEPDKSADLCLWNTQANQLASLSPEAQLFDESTTLLATLINGMPVYGNLL